MKKILKYFASLLANNTRVSMPCVGDIFIPSRIIKNSNQANLLLPRSDMRECNMEASFIM